jgi:fluoroquinolone transport system permease protein
MTALQVTPLPMRSYMAYRVALPVLFSFAAIALFLPLAGLGSLSTPDLLVTALVAAPLAPLFGLFTASFSHNKVQAFALMKGVGILLFSPIFAYFVSSRWELLFGIIPAYWPLKVYWLLESGAANVWLYAAIGLLYQAVLIVLSQRRFYKVLHR